MHISSHTGIDCYYIMRSALKKRVEREREPGLCLLRSITSLYIYDLFRKAERTYGV